MKIAEIVPNLMDQDFDELFIVGGVRGERQLLSAYSETGLEGLAHAAAGIARLAAELTTASKLH